MGRTYLVKWLSAGVLGSLSFWLFQVLTGDSTITQFMGEQIATEGGYPMRLAPLIGWGVHLAVSLSYALLFILIMAVLPLGSTGAAMGVGVLVALVLGWVTTLLTAPAIAVTIGVLSGKGFPAELPGLNTDGGLPLYNHLLFFGVVWLLTTVLPALTRRA